jgi:hypothetical protein
LGRALPKAAGVSATEEYEALAQFFDAKTTACALFTLKSGQILSVQGIILKHRL